MKYEKWSELSRKLTAFTDIKTDDAVGYQPTIQVEKFIWEKVGMQVGE